MPVKHVDHGTTPSLLLMGQDSHGNWVVQDRRGLCGGIFVDRKSALRFAMFENGHRPQGVLMVPGTFELDMKGDAADRSGRPLDIDWRRKPRAA